jgi:5-oxoprolinase (ATP-hydrolysing)
MAWQFWIDRGGTFTDIVARTPAGRLTQHKFLSENPDRHSDAAIAGIREILELETEANIPAGLIEAVKMGTTVGTNALLTRTGEPTLLITTAGFADQLLIGDQSRPDIFALQINKIAPLYEEVIEVNERMDASGHVIHALDDRTLERLLVDVGQRGIKACAIAFLHSWINPSHELLAGKIAARLGFKQISLSHQASPLIRFLPRTETAVLDAYLSPPLRSYVNNVMAALPNDARLEFMQSNGGLVPADRFQGKDSVLSGPAGGLIGMIKVGSAAGFERLIGFDMGGTSTDVSLYAGELERQAETQIAGCRVRVPMLAVHTVAAGGGSILHFDGTRLSVGPDSAGSLPGPKSYRRGGPLTVTDANMFLGRIQTSHFPALFGPDGALPLDADGVATAFRNLTDEVNNALNLTYTAERMAEGFLDIAVENMADAVRHITLERGVNPAQFALVCFGGAGGQLACRVAASLGMSQILVSPYAAVLSAYGIGLAEQREVRQIAVERRLDEIPPAPDTAGEVRALLRYAGADTTLAVAFGDISEMARTFHELHRTRFGFADAKRELICTAIEIEIVSGGDEPTGTQPGHSQPGAFIETVHLYCNEAWHDASLYRRNDLCTGQTIAGPALIIEAGSCTVIDPGWTVTMTERGDLLLTGTTNLSRSPNIDYPDPTWLSLFNRRFMSIAEDMGRVLQMTARSVNIRERLDFSCALFDAVGNLIANAPHIPVHLGSMGDSVRAILNRFTPTMQPGDAYLINSPYAGGTHLPDITVVSPVFDGQGRKLLYFTAARAHHADVGGIAPGSMPANSRHIDDEGCRSDGLLLVREGAMQTDAVRAWLNSNPRPARNPEQNLADLSAQVAACHMGIRLLRQLEGEVGEQAVITYMDFVQDNAEAAVLRLLGKLKDGHFKLPLDGGGHVSVSIRIQEQRAVIDFTGTSGPHPGNLNAPSAIVHSAVLYVFRTLLDTDIPLNAGVLRPLEIRLPPDSLLNPDYPAAVVAGNVETSQNIVDALYGALGALAASQGTMNNFSFGDGQHQYYETVCGGTGAGANFNGVSAVHSHMTNSRMTDPEVLELNFPVRVEHFGIRAGSGGAGHHRGGDGIVRRLRFLAPMQANLIALRREVPSFGLSGGKNGQVGQQWIERTNGTREILSGIAEFSLEIDDQFVLETPGGGGYGEPSKL